MDTVAFEQLVVEVLDQLPDSFARYLDNVAIIVEPQLTEEHRAAFALAPDEIIYGFYEGIPLTERSALDFAPPDTIYIFQNTLVADFPDPAELREEVRRTVLHELAHLFGISDARLDELGAY